MSNLITEMGVHVKEGIISKEERNGESELVESTEGYF
jgi:hypothetical protein